MPYDYQSCDLQARYTATQLALLLCPCDHFVDYAIPYHVHIPVPVCHTVLREQGPIVGHYTAKRLAVLSLSGEQQVADRQVYCSVSMRLCREED